MARCRACGGILGRDCFNEQDCLMISMQQSQQQPTQIISDGYNEGYAEGYNAAQSILQKEHEVEMRDFEKWKIKSINITELDEDDCLQYGHKNGQWYSYQGLLQLFRERDGK